jgi:hypothetical protein
MKQNNNWWLIPAFLGASMGGIIGGGVLTYTLVGNKGPIVKVVEKKVETTKYVDLEGLSIEKGVKLELKDDLDAILEKGQLPFKTIRFVPDKWNVINKANNKESLPELIRRSIKEPAAQQYIADTMRKIENKVYGPNPSISPLELAVEGMKIPRGELANRIYNLNQGVDKGDSTLTLAESLAEKKGILRSIRGDCKDATTALLTTYEGLREMACKKRNNSKFHEKLCLGLLRYQMIGVYYSKKTDQLGNKNRGHVFIGAITYDKNWGNFKITPVEPQSPGTPQILGLSKEDYFFTMHNNKLIHVDARFSDKINLHHITWVYNSHGVYSIK